jgi:hypothetical protein
MYERPILREHIAPFAELVPLADGRYGLAPPPARTASPAPKSGLLRRGVTLVAVALPAAAGIATDHLVLGVIGSVLTLALAGLVAFGLSVLDGTIELY